VPEYTGAIRFIGLKWNFFLKRSSFQFHYLSDGDLAETLGVKRRKA